MNNIKDLPHLWWLKNQIWYDLYLLCVYVWTWCVVLVLSTVQYWSGNKVFLCADPPKRQLAFPHWYMWLNPPTSSVNLIRKISSFLGRVTVRSRVLLQALTVAQLVKYYPPFIWPQSSIPNGPYPKRDKLGEQMYLKTISILSFHIWLCLPNGYFSSGFATKTIDMFLASCIRATCPVHLIFLHLICLIISSPRCSVFSISVIPTQSWVQISSSILFVYVVSLGNLIDIFLYILMMMYSCQNNILICYTTRIVPVRSRDWLTHKKKTVACPGTLYVFTFLKVQLKFSNKFADFAWQ